MTFLKATFVAFVQRKIFSFKMIDMNEDNMKNRCFFCFKRGKYAVGEIKSLSKEVKTGDMSKQFNNFSK